MPDEKTAAPHAEAMEKETHTAETAGNPEHANPQPMMANAPSHKAEKEMGPSNEQPDADKNADKDADKDVNDENVAPAEDAASDDEEKNDDKTDEAANDQDKDASEDQSEEPPPAVPGTPANTGTVLHQPPVTPAKPPAPETITPSKTASSNPKEGVPILDSNHTLSHIPPRDTTI